MTRNCLLQLVQKPTLNPMHPMWETLEGRKNTRHVFLFLFKGIWQKTSCYLISVFVMRCLIRRLWINCVCSQYRLNMYSVLDFACDIQHVKHVDIETTKWDWFFILSVQHRQRNTISVEILKLLSLILDMIIFKHALHFTFKYTSLHVKIITHHKTYVEQQLFRDNELCQREQENTFCFQPIALNTRYPVLSNNVSERCHINSMGWDWTYRSLAVEEFLEGPLGERSKSESER